MTFVHLIPSDVFSNTYQGSYKDTISRVRLFESHAQEYVQVQLHDDNPPLALACANEWRSPEFFIEYSLFPKTVKAIRRLFPESKIAVRSHNIEPMQHFDNHGFWSKRGPIWVGYGMARLLKADFSVKSNVDVIYSISPWESDIYWARLPGKARIKWLPYHCPDHLLPVTGVGSDYRNRIVCMPTSQKNRKSWDLVTRFITFAERLKPVLEDEYEFMVTGNVANWGLPDSGAVQYIGMVDDLRQFLPTVKAVALLSDLGYGFKTTISDAIANGAIVLLHPKLYRRCPVELSDGVVPIDSADISSAADLVERLQPSGTFTCGDSKLRKQAESLLFRDFSSLSVHN